MARHCMKLDRYADKHRSCLMCDKRFASQGPENRRCKPCCTRLMLHERDTRIEQRERTDGDYVYN